MIYMTESGVRVDDTEWSGASPGYDGIRVRFANGASVTVTEAFLRHALDLIEFDRERVVTNRAALGAANGGGT